MKNPFVFDSKVAVVTGASGVLCGAISQGLADCGAAVAVVGGRNLQKARTLAETIRKNGGRAVAFTCDVTDRQSVERLRDEVINEFGRVDILVNGAGGAHKDATTSPDLPFSELPPDAVRYVLDLNFLGTFYACQVFSGEMAKSRGGRILNISSMGAVHPLTRSVAYSAAKAAVSNFTQWLAVHVSQEYPQADIRVNEITPGFFLTEQNKFLLHDPATGDYTERGRRVIAHTPLNRFGKPEDIIGPALWLLGDAAQFVHGASVIVDGGMNAYGGI